MAGGLNARDLDTLVCLDMGPQSRAQLAKSSANSFRIPFHAADVEYQRWSWQGLEIHFEVDGLYSTPTRTNDSRAADPKKHRDNVAHWAVSSL